MSVYFIKGRGWRYDFTLKGTRYTNAWFDTKSTAKQAEAKRREEIENPKPSIQPPIGMDFLELVNKRLDYVFGYNSPAYYKDHRSFARKWIKKWGDRRSDEITTSEIQSYILARGKVARHAANAELRCLRALFNFAMERGVMGSNPTKGIRFLPISKPLKYIPSKEDVLKVILAADPETQDYLYTIRETMARVNEVNQLTWPDIDFDGLYVVLYTRKKKGGHRTPRKIPMTKKLYEVLLYRYKNRDKSKPWVFWHSYWSSKKGEWVEGPYKDRKLLMRQLCKRAGVRYFRYHALRHHGASILDQAGVNISSIQRILGHENRSTTEIYLHSIGESEREAMAIFESECEKSHTDSHTGQSEGLGNIP